jgi:hypothetical protein
MPLTRIITLYFVPMFIITTSFASHLGWCSSCIRFLCMTLIPTNLVSNNQELHCWPTKNTSIPYIYSIYTWVVLEIVYHTIYSLYTLYTLYLLYCTYMVYTTMALPLMYLPQWAFPSNITCTWTPEWGYRFRLADMVSELPLPR